MPTYTMPAFPTHLSLLVYPFLCSLLPPSLCINLSFTNRGQKRLSWCDEIIFFFWLQINLSLERERERPRENTHTHAGSSSFETSSFLSSPICSGSSHLSCYLHLMLALGPSPLWPPHPLLSLAARSGDVPHSLLLLRLGSRGGKSERGWSGGQNYHPLKGKERRWEKRVCLVCTFFWEKKKKSGFEGLRQEIR